MINEAALNPRPSSCTGHSLGGSVAALVALLLRLDPRVPEEQRVSIRAVCFSCMSMVGRELSEKLRPFVTTVIIGEERPGPHTQCP